MITRRRWLAHCSASLVAGIAVAGWPSLALAARNVAPSLVGVLSVVPDGLDAVLARATTGGEGYRSMAERRTVNLSEISTD